MKVKILTICKLGFAGVLSVLAGCATMKSLPPYEATHFSMHQESRGIKVFVEPFSDQNTIKKYFGTDLISNGIFPFCVRIVNGTDNTSILVDESTFSLKLKTDIESTSESKEIIDSSAGADAAMVGAYVSPALMLYGNKLFTDAMVINSAFNQNRLKPTTVSPGKNVSGFVYFSLPEKGVIPKDWNLKATIKSISGDEKVKLIF